MRTIEQKTDFAAAARRSISTYVSGKIQGHHLEKLVVVYVRQSTPRQVLEHHESTDLQYKLADRAVALGWPRDRVLVIDDDLGQSGTTAENRVGFQRLLAEIGLSHVGLVLGIEMSRLARSGKDWHQLLELCAVFGSLLADLDGLYDPGHYNDRLLLGLKGTMSEAELHLLRTRLMEGKRNKAERGELFGHQPTGYARLPSGEVLLDPDEQVQSIIRLIFAKFEELATGRQVFSYMQKHEIRIPVRPASGPNQGQLEWREPTPSTLHRILRHPQYAGAYVYGRSPTDPRRKIPGRRGTGKTRVPMGQWQVLLRGVLPAYITWEPENRLVARELERHWERALLAQHKVQEEYERFQQAHPKDLSAADRQQIVALSADIPALWTSPSTMVADRQEVIRKLVEKVVIHAQGKTEVVDVTIHWIGGYVSQHEIRRSIWRYTDLRDHGRLIGRLKELQDAGFTAGELAKQLNMEGFHSPQRGHPFNVAIVRSLLSRNRLTARPRRDATVDVALHKANEWWLEELASELEMACPTLQGWCRRGWVHARKVTVAYRRFVIWADGHELDRLRRLRDYQRPSPRVPYPRELTTPRPRTEP